MCVASTPAIIDAASLERNGFQTRYSIDFGPSADKKKGLILFKKLQLNLN